MNSFDRVHFFLFKNSSFIKKITPKVETNYFMNIMPLNSIEKGIDVYKKA